MSSRTDELIPESDEDRHMGSVEEEFADTVVLSDTQSTDNVGDASVEINVEQLIAEIEGSVGAVSAHEKEVRRRLEELAEERSFEDTYAIDFDEDD